MTYGGNASNASVNPQNTVFTTSFHAKKIVKTSNTCPAMRNSQKDNSMRLWHRIKSHNISVRQGLCRPQIDTRHGRHTSAGANQGPEGTYSTLGCSYMMLSIFLSKSALLPMEFEEGIYQLWVVKKELKMMCPFFTVYTCVFASVSLFFVCEALFAPQLLGLI